MSAKNLTLLTDFYELTMMQGYFEKENTEVVIFDMFFRVNPDNAGYSVMAGLEQVVDYIKKGISICIFPEGTRNTGEELSMLPFKEGAFKIATKTGCPIIPISMNNTSDVFENHMPRIKKVHVVLEYGTPIYPNELAPEDKKHIGAYCQNIIQETIHKNAELL